MRNSNQIVFVVDVVVAVVVFVVVVVPEVAVVAVQLQACNARTVHFSTFSYLVPNVLLFDAILSHHRF